MNSTTHDKPENIQKDLADSFEAFRTAPSGYLSGTRASSDIGASQFTKRFLAWHEREFRAALQLAVVSAEIRGMENAKNRVLRRTEIPRDAKNPTRDATVYLGEAIADIIQADIESLSKQKAELEGGDNA